VFLSFVIHVHHHPIFFYLVTVILFLVSPPLFLWEWELIFLAFRFYYYWYLYYFITQNVRSSIPRVPSYYLLKPLFLLSLFLPLFSYSEVELAELEGREENDNDDERERGGRVTTMKTIKRRRKKGCAVVYSKLIHPFLSAHEPFLDDSLHHVQKNLSMMGREVRGMSSDIIQNVASNVVGVVSMYYVFPFSIPHTHTDS
jgi:hypothetical protein